MRARSILLVLCGLALASTTACSGADESESGPAAEDEVKSGSLLAQAVAVQIDGGATVAAPAKLKRVLDNLGLGAGSKKPKEGAFRCMPTYRLEFFKADGTSLAKGGLMCGAGARQDVQGSLQINDKSYLIVAKDVDAIDAIAKEPLAVADALFGTDRVKIGQPSKAGATVETTEGAEVAKAVKAFRGDDVPDPKASMPKCVPSRVVTFLNGSKVLGSVSFMCGPGGEGSTTSTGSFFVKDDLAGGVQVNTKALLDIEKAISAK